MSETRGVTPKLTSDDLAAIEARATAVAKMQLNAHQRIGTAFQVCMQDVPDLLVEIRRLRRRPSPTTEGQT